MAIRLFFEKKLPYTEKNGQVKKWVKEIAQREGKLIESLNIVTVPNEEIRRLNKEFLGRKYNTDVIAFGEENDKGIEGEIYISIDKVEQNAKEYNTDVKEEWRRMIVHGLLHLAGYRDDISELKREMGYLEDYYLKNFPE